MNKTTPVLCKVCEAEIDAAESVRGGICHSCHLKLGLAEMPPARRSARPCTVCNKLRFIRVIPREYTAYAVKGGYIALGAPMALTRDTGASDRLFFKGKTVPGTPSLEGGRGTLEAYVCSGCGFVEWYCNDPEAIPIGPEFMSEVIDYGPDAPFR
jgi:hypothetical protein